MRRLFGEGLWVLLGQILVAATALASLKLWAIYLLPEEVGVLGLVVGFASILVGVMVGPVTQAILISYAAHREDRSSSFRTTAGRLVLAQCLIGICLLLIVGFPVAYVTGSAPIMPLLAAGFVAIEARRAFEISLLAAKRRQKEVAWVYGGDSLARFAGLWLALHIMPPTAASAMTGVLFGAFVFFLVSSFLFRQERFALSQRATGGGDPAVRDRIRQMARPLYPSSALASVTEMLNRYLIAVTIGVGAAGIFVVSYGLVKRPYGLLNGVTDFTMRPVMASAIAERDTARIARAKLVWLAVGAGFAILGVILFHFLQDLVVRILLSQEYASAAELLPVIALAVALFNVANIFGGFSLAAGNSRAVLVNNAVGAVSGGVLTVVLCIYFGLPGAAWALVGGYFFQLITAILTSRFRLPNVWRQNLDDGNRP